MSDTPINQSMPLDGYGDWLVDLKGRIHNAQQRANLMVNRELVLMYWQSSSVASSNASSRPWKVAQVPSYHL
ncbi:hypothetical protein [Pseudomonas sp. PD9R]|uniref:hypothetical protein n=1 Tax=Pseudomonas sp. PD9R TaxID=2853534 RepID=UPI0035265993